jgi:hypothetical protein
MLTVTKAEVLALKHCELYPPERIKDLFAGRDALTAQDILAMPISPGDKLSVLLRTRLTPPETLAKVREIYLARINPDFDLYPRAAASECCVVISCYCAHFAKRHASTVEERQAAIEAELAWCLAQVEALLV